MKVLLVSLCFLCLALVSATTDNVDGACTGSIEDSTHFALSISGGDKCVLRKAVKNLPTLVTATK